jgi:oligoribonuclease (3'-5' exoribonuclease)
VGIKIEEEAKMDLMLDLETFDNTSTTTIVQIGAVIFDRDTEDIIDEFKVNVDPQSCVALGFTIGVDTVMWWLKQAEEARASITSSSRVEVSEALKSLKAFVEKYEPDTRKVNVWCHATFDFPIMQNYFKATKIEAPWRYTSAKDLRTLADVSGANIYAIPRKGTYHDAIDDCKHQIKQLHMCFKALQKKSFTLDKKPSSTKK